jgi:hypothetical protein
MADTQVLDQTFTFIMRHMIDTGRAPHYTAVAAGLGLDTESGRQAVRDVLQVYFPGWLYPGTDYIASFAPLNDLTTQYRVSAAGEQRWYAQ